MNPIWPFKENKSAQKIEIKMKLAESGYINPTNEELELLIKLKEKHPTLDYDKLYELLRNEIGRPSTTAERIRKTEARTINKLDDALYPFTLAGRREKQDEENKWEEKRREQIAEERLEKVSDKVYGRVVLVVDSFPVDEIPAEIYAVGEPDLNQFEEYQQYIVRDFIFLRREGKLKKDAEALEYLKTELKKKRNLSDSRIEIIAQGMYEDITSGKKLSEIYGVKKIKEDSFKTPITWKGVPTGDYKILIASSFKDYKFQHWKIWESDGKGKTTYIKSTTDRIFEYYVKTHTKFVAYFGGVEVKHDKTSLNQTHARGGYGQIAGGNNFSPTNLLRTSAVGGRISKDIARREFKEGESPYLRSAINKGKRMLNGYAKVEYSRLFDPLKKDFKDKTKKLKELKKKAKEPEKRLKQLIREDTGQAFITRFRKKNIMDALSGAENMLKREDVEAKKDIEDMRETVKEYVEYKEDYEKELRGSFEAASAQLRNYMKDKAGIVSTTIARRYKIQMGSESEAALKAELANYADEIAEHFIVRGRTVSHALLRGLGVLSRGSATLGDVWYNIINNLWTLITGPWLLGVIMFMLQFYFIMTFSKTGYNYMYLWLLPAVGAATLFIINIESSRTPFDWLAHIISGAIIANTVSIIFFALGFYPESWLWYLMWALIALFIGVFQLYQAGGFRVIFQVAVIAMVFGWIAMGPYSAYYNVVKEQIKAPIKSAYEAIKDAFVNVWLLATNPTEWYARQQVMNVRPEKPIDYPRGIEIVSLDALPPSVQGYVEGSTPTTFSIAAVIRNDGMQDANNIDVKYGCKNDCDSLTGIKEVSETKLQPGVGSLIWIRDIQTSAKLSSRAAETKIAKVEVNVTYTYSTNSTLQVELMKSTEIQRRFKEQQDVFRPITAVAKTTPAQMSLNVGPQPIVVSDTIKEADYSIDSCKNGLYACEDKDIGPGLIKCENSKWVLTGDKPTYGTLEQCKTACKQIANCIYTSAANQMLLVSILNKRTDGTVIIGKEDKESDDKITKMVIRLPKSIGSGLSCPGVNPESITSKNNRVYYRDDNEEALLIKISKLQVIQASQFNTIFSFTCTFNPEKNIPDVRTGLITAELYDYRFSITKEKDVTITAPLGITLTKEMSKTVAKTVVGSSVQDYVSKYNQYSSVIDSAVAANNLGSYIDNPGALVAALITQESKWDEKAVSPCGSAGIIQFIKGTAQSMGLKVPDTYGTSSTCQPSLCGKSASAWSNCNSCTKNTCDYTNDERFIPEKAIPTGVRYLTQNIKNCGGVWYGVAAYNSGKCGQEANSGYVNAIKGYYESWKQAIQQSSSSSTSSYDPNFCANQISINRNKCIIGQGGCRSNDECFQDTTAKKYIPSECTDVNNDGTSMKICCPTTYNEMECRAAYNNWAKNKKS
jgi:hypothetical protein